MKENLRVNCPISGNEMELVFSELLLNKYEVKYYYCQKCGLLKTETPYWLNEAYSNAINDSDTGLINRNIENVYLSEIILELFKIGNGKFLDIAGGYGIFTRLMRDRGFDCYTTDKYCENLFSKYFEPDSDFKADSLFMFEVLEHIENPLLFIEENFEKYKCKTLIFSTLIYSDKIPQKDWWYYSFETGQHITFYQEKTLLTIAEILNCNYYKLSNNFHIITDINISTLKKIILSNRYMRKICSIYLKHKRRDRCKILEDHLTIKNKN